MSVINTVNYGSITYSSGTMQWSTADADIFNRTHVSNTAQALEQHDHTSGKGLGVGNISSTITLTNAGDIKVTASTMQFKDSGGATHTLPTLDGTNTFSGTDAFTGTVTAASGTIDFSGATSLKVPVSAGATPTTSGLIAYDSTGNQLVAGVNGATKTILTTGAVVTVSQGGTGASTLTAHGVLLGEGTSAIAATSAGTVGYPLLSGGASADPSFAQITSTGISSTYTSGLLQLQSGSDAGHKFQRVSSGPIFWNFGGVTSVSWPLTFGTTPHAVGTCIDSSTGIPIVTLNGISTTALICAMSTGGTTGSGTNNAEIWGIG